MQLSIVVPVYKSRDCLPELARRIQQEMSGRFHRYELILVNDDSPDTSWDVIVRLTEEYDFITGVNLRKNAGQDNAIMAGLHYAHGEVVVIMDDDLQHDPADIPSLYEAAQNGFDVVYAHFNKKKQAFWKNLGSWFNDWIAVFVLGKPRHLYMSPYKALRREVVDELIKYDGPYSYVDGLLFTITSNFMQIPAIHHERFAGKSNYNLMRSIAVWLKVATSFSAIPLRIATVVGGTISLSSFMIACFFVVKTLLGKGEPEGWPSLSVSIFFLGGIQLMGIGAIGEYIARIFITQNKRPQFTVKAIHRSTRTPETRHIHKSIPFALR